MIPTFHTPPGAKNPGNKILEAEGSALETELLAPFHPSVVDWKPGPGKEDSNSVLVFPYLDADAIRGRLNKVCGIGGWQGVPYQIAPGQIGYAIGIWINGQWIVKADGAFAGDLDLDGVAEKDYQKALDAAAKDAKGGISNALKRAGMSWGMGFYLKDLSNSKQPGKVYEEVRQAGRSKVLTDDAKGRLYDLAEKPFLDHWHDIAVRHEKSARSALEKNNLSGAYGAAVQALKIRDDVFGADHASAKRVRDLLEGIRARQKSAGTGAPRPPASDPAAPAGAAPAITGGQPPTDGQTAAASAPAATPSQGHGAAPQVDPDLRVVIDRMTAAGSPDEVKKIAAAAWKKWAPESVESNAFHAAFESAMQRWISGWTIAGAEAAKRAAQPAAPAQPAPDGSAPAATRDPASARGAKAPDPKKGTGKGRKGEGAQQGARG